MRPAPSPRLIAAALLAALGFVALVHGLISGPATIPGFLVDHGRAPAPDSASLSMEFLCNPCGTAQIHAPAIAEAANGDLVAVWYGGSREGAGDVALYASRRPASGAGWTRPQPVITRAQAASALGRHIKKLGNPVIGRDVRGRLWLVFVSVSAGGWSGSALNVTFSKDDGHTWSRPIRLVTSPFFNVSTLAKGAPLPLQDGGMAIPVYHELLGKFAEWLVLDASGSVIGKRRIGWGRGAIQPSAVALDPSTVVALMRDSADTRRVQRAVSGDGGRHWDAIRPTELPNPDAAVAAVRVAGDAVLLVFNDAVEGRRRLGLAVSRDEGMNWKRIHVLEAAPDGETDAEFSYPYATRAANGDVHIVYTWNRTAVRHVRLGAGWLEARL